MRSLATVLASSFASGPASGSFTISMAVRRTASTAFTPSAKRSPSRSQRRVSSSSRLQIAANARLFTHTSASRRGDDFERHLLSRASRLHVVVHGIGEPAELRRMVALGKRSLARRGIRELRYALLAHGVFCIYGIFHRHDAPRGEGPAVAVVAEQHRLLHRLRDLRLAAEHFGDGVSEDRARRVVGGLLAGLAQDVARLVQAQRGDGDPLRSKLNCAFISSAMVLTPFSCLFEVVSCLFTRRAAKGYTFFRDTPAFLACCIFYQISDSFGGGRRLLLLEPPANARLGLRPRF